MQIDLDYRELSLLRIILEERIVSTMDANASELHASSVFRQHLFDKLQKAEKESAVSLPVDMTLKVDDTKTELRMEKDGSVHIMPGKNDDAH